ncbi:MAG: glycosyltransferase [Candidatus Micrarchaeota archaeon]|nr:glycosyltransferase [Candidatus Micrarchaeota archaeon]
MLGYYFAVVTLVIALASFLYYSINSYMALSYSEEIRAPSTDADVSDATVIVPVYEEDPETFKQCIEAIKLQGSKFIVVGDSSNEPYRKITTGNGGSFIFLKKHSGQRAAHAAAMKHVDTKYVLLVDSDTIIPPNALKSMLSKMDDGIGGVGTRISIKPDGWVSYSAEFFQRAKDVIFKAMASSGYIFVVGGRCCLLRTSAVKGFMASEEFLESKVLGRKCIIAEDMHITNHMRKLGYKAVIDYGVNVVTDAPRTFGSLFKQMVRWARGGYIYFLKDIADGAFFKNGALYSFEMFYIYLLPVTILVTGIIRIQIMMEYGASNIIGSGIGSIGNLMFLNTKLMGSGVATYMGIAMIVSTIGTIVFLLTLLKFITKSRLKTMALGGITSLIMFLASIYALATVWKQDDWLTR